MPTSKPPTLSLTLILAATPSLGIGQAGTLPWPQLKKEMGYFARVTKRVPLKPSHDGGPEKRVNAVVMGRKTWDSIPEKFRPLKGRLNVVITRDAGSERWESERKSGGGVEGPIIADSVGAAIDALRSEELKKKGIDVERVFVIGGGSIYKAALELPETNRILLTKIKKDFECDTFFPLDLDKEESWRETGKKEADEWVGEDVGEREEAGVGFEFCVYEKMVS
ncbi:hypothetical protein K504DRAFT_528922 [Pleomassaria siparia CBS 279.74]|uniref:Dihydrofolate reductase n=1 Tax=Pleomassaria siparia CBS 279.74 TaxID=1314801 RepID=A0A6G1KQG3_9PLEO|nr:hypothetical protein K504DRAFT_528922 [Pleomassaria siparia CBS 279.74]